MDKKIEQENFKKDVLELHQKGWPPISIANQLYEKYNVDISDARLWYNFKSRVRKCVSRYERRLAKKLHWNGEHKIIQKHVAIQNVEPTTHDRVWDGTTEIKFAVIGDTHLGSKYTQLTHLNNFYDICEAEGIKDVYHAGDVTDGIKMRPGHEYELYAVSTDDMLQDVINNYPRRKGITTHFITGNHDASIYKHVGHDIGRSISHFREDMNYLGRDCAVINLTDKCTLELRHPWDGTAYALSYKPQKMIEAMESDSKPNILAIGHYHKAEYLFYRNVHTIQTGCFEGQTPFTRGKGISVNIGGWIITIKVSEDGTIKSITPQFIPYYKSISEDYKHR